MNSYEHLLDFTKEDFENLPHKRWNEEILCDSIVLIPTDNIHDSGFGCIDVVAIKDYEPVCRCAGGSDVIHINGIGGYGEYESNAWNIFRDTASNVPISAWSIDLLPCGYFRLFVQSSKIKIGEALSSLEIFSDNGFTKEGK